MLPIFSPEKEGCHNKPRRGRRWFTSRCGRCFSSNGSGSFTSSTLNIPIEMSLATSSSQPDMLNSDESEAMEAGVRANAELPSGATVDLRSFRAMSNSCPSIQTSRQNCGEQNVLDRASLRRSVQSLGTFHSDGFQAPCKTYMHQVVVVAPPTGEYRSAINWD